MEIIHLDLEQVTEEELTLAISQNNRTLNELNAEIKKISLASTKQLEEENNFILSKNSSDEHNVSETNQRNDSLYDTIEYYYQNIVSINSLDTKVLEEEILENLPNSDSENYDMILLQIQMRLLKNIKEIEEFINDVDKIGTDDLSDFKAEVELNDKKIKLISKIRKENKAIEDIDNTDNNLIFVPTSGGNIRVLEELSHIDSEYLEEFKGLFDSIKDGSFKNVKRFSNTNSKNAGVSEVRDYKIRVVFDRISPHDYAIITAFIKKSDNDAGYLKSLISKVKNYDNIRAILKNNLNNPEFMNLQKEYENELYNILNQTSKSKQHVKREA